MSEGMTQKEKERAVEAAKEAGVGIRPTDTREIDSAAAKTGNFSVGPKSC